MLLSFIKSIRNEISIVVCIFLLFALIFFLFTLPFNAFGLALGIVLLVISIHWWIKYLGFKKDESLKETIDNLENELTEVKNQQVEYRNDVESYFLTWVHQIKTPITASQLLLERNEENVVNRVRQEIVQIDNYTSLALSYLKLLNEESDMTISEVEINELIRPLIMKYRIQFIEQHTRIHYEKCEDKVLTDAQWASIMIEQILNNALKYARGKDIWIEFDASEQSLIIKDNGVGISKADIPKIFDKGYSGYNGRLNEESSGIGLFIVKHISNHLNHEVDVDSKLNEGTTFKIHFPRED
ncbi:sensor histidine kinase [Staphylococcus caprae]|uniref:sensor histidine kinase n=1 Tax=Staphylococcus caprae TaxID=29380 RepID=UPI001C10065E|nr:sensor histidine kinase [Staphylococcus caprae]MBU5271948.1 sensor histidine kinase [Staphylococcus caprae]